MAIKVTGYMLRDAIKEHELARDTASAAFDPSLKAFPGDTGAKKTPQEIMEVFLREETIIAKLQVAQMVYNLHVKVNVLGVEMSLGEAIKLVGGLGRAEKMWKGAIQDRRNSYMDVDVRDPNQVRAERTVTSDECLALARNSGKSASALRAAIATSNGVVVEFTDLDASFFE